MNSPEPADIGIAKRKNIIEMALSFAAMLRNFAEGSNDRIGAKLEEFFLGLGEIRDRDDYDLRHRSFCEWFRRNIRTAERTFKSTRVHPSGPSSYGQAAKVLDIVIKVYVYYCAQPTSEVAERILPFLHGAIDTPIMRHLKKCSHASARIPATTIKAVDEDTYQALQSRLLAESQAYGLHPVQYDDILWRRLNRNSATRAYED